MFPGRENTINQSVVADINRYCGYLGAGTPAVSPEDRTQAISHSSETKTANAEKAIAYSALTKLNRDFAMQVKTALDTKEGLDLSNLKNSSGLADFWNRFHTAVNSFITNKIKPIFDQGKDLGYNEINITKNQVAFGDGLSLVVRFLNSIAGAFQRRTGQVIKIDELLDLSGKLSALIEATRKLNLQIINTLGGYWNFQGQGEMSNQFAEILDYNPGSDNEALVYNKEKLLAQVNKAIELGYPLKHIEGASSTVHGCPAGNFRGSEQSMIDLFYGWLVDLIRTDCKEDLEAALAKDPSSLVPVKPIKELSCIALTTRSGTQISALIYQPKSKPEAVVISISDSSGISNNDAQELVAQLKDVKHWKDDPSIPYAAYVDKKAVVLEAKSLEEAIKEIAVKQLKIDEQAKFHSKLFRAAYLHQSKMLAA